MALTNRDKAVLMGLFLSKFDKMALESFGFVSFKEAFNVFGYSVGIPPSSIKNYRDEFDPYFPNDRKGWHNRELREYCREIMDKFGNLSFDEFYRLVNSFVLDEQVDINDIKFSKHSPKHQGFVANRLITGKAAEEYFEMNYHGITPFQDYALANTTNMGCGFDFKLSHEADNFYVEVKGINEKRGNLLMTEKEHDMAEVLQERYCLFVVSDFRDAPVHQLFFNPLYCNDLRFQRQEQKVLQISYSIKIV